MATRRRKGEGSIHQRSDGRWTAYITHEKDAFGKSHRTYVYGKTAEEVGKKLRDVQRAADRGMIRPKKHADSFEIFATRWLEDIVKHRTAERTYVDYKACLENHVFPDMGTQSLQKLTSTKIQDFYGALARKGVQARTRQKVHVLVHQVLKHATRQGILIANPAANVERPRYKAGKRPHLELEQIRQLLGVAEGTWFHAAIALAAFTGIRQGEMLALHWGDISGRQMSISKSLQNSEGARVLKATKTASSARLVTLPPIVLEALKAHQKRLETTGLGVKARNLVFPNERGGMFDSTKIKAPFDTLLTQAGLPIVRWHDLRHSAASNLLSLGTHLKVIQETLGHASIAITSDLYSHLLPSLQPEAMDRLHDAYTALEKSDSTK